MLIAHCRTSHKPLVRDRKFIRSYTALGHDVVFLGNRRGTTVAPDEDGVQVEYVGFSYPYYSKWTIPGTCGYAWGVAAALRRLCPEAIHVRDLEALMGVSVYKRALNRTCKVIYDIGDAFSARYNVPAFLANTIQFVDDTLSRSCDVVVLPQANRMSNFRYFRPDNVHVIHNCPFLTDAPLPAKVPTDGPVRVLLSGQMMWTRGIRQIVSAAREAGNVEIFAVTGKYQNGVREYMEDSGVVRFFPEMAQKEVLQLAQQCHLIGAYYDPSRRINRQAAPNKVYDAMAAGRPVLVNAEVEVASEICDGWGVGYSLPYHDKKGLVSLFRSSKADPTDCAARGARGRQLFAQKYHWELMTDVIRGYLG
jgi:glycosyltransferase involved in cell wall biosynthesis